MLRLARLRTRAPGAPGGALRLMCSQSGRPCLTLMAQPSCDPRAGRRRLVVVYDASRGSTRGVGRVGIALGYRAGWASSWASGWSSGPPLCLAAYMYR